MKKNDKQENIIDPATAKSSKPNNFFQNTAVTMNPGRTTYHQYIPGWITAEHDDMHPGDFIMIRDYYKSGEYDDRHLGDFMEESESESPSPNR